jgi:hypothetical protein
MKSARCWRLGFLVGILFGLVALSVPSLGVLAGPGWLLSWPFYPQGFHSRGGAGIDLLAVIFVGTVLFWATTAFTGLSLAARIGTKKAENV